MFDRDAFRSPRKQARKAFLRWPGRGSSHNRFRALCVVFIANDDLHFVDCRGSFSLYETMEPFLQSRELEQMALTVYVFGGIRGMLSRDAR